MSTRKDTKHLPDGSTVDTATGEVAPPATDTEAEVARELAPVPRVDWPVDPSADFLLAVLRRQVTVRSVDTEAMSRAIAERALGAETPQEALRTATPDGWEGYVGLAVTVFGVSFAPSGYDEGCPVYVTADAVRAADGQPMTLTIGAWSVVYQCIAFVKAGWWPRTVALESTRTKSNYDTYRLIDATV